MRAIRLHTFGADPAIETVPDPVAGPGETLVRIVAAAAGHLDRTIISGDFLEPPALPYTPGVEAAGVVVSSAAYAEGTPVWLRGGGLGVARDGTWSELVVAPDAAVHPMPRDCDFALAACFYTAATTAHVALHEVARVRPGERVAVSGAAGSVGALVVQLAAAAGAVPVALVADDARAALVPPVAVEVVVGAAPAKPVDVLVDTMGGPELPELLRSVAPGGRAVLIGYVSGTRLELDLSRDLIQRDVSLLPVNMLRRQQAAREAADTLLPRLARGELTLPVTRYPFGQAPAALAALAQGQVTGRLALTVD
ncbi:quinone oxidoreductase family protein [Micromonospora marina]|uniref:quinone oxidoreductase family protein n=1 Tax=Micromonospora marina TaxID=307120 RepID=UPI003451C00E